MNIFSFKGFDFVVLLLFFSKLSMNWFSYTFFFKCFTATKALEEFNHDYLKGYVMKIKLCPNEADETTVSENNNSFDSNDGESDTSENCRCRRYCQCQVDESESLENESDEETVPVSTSESSRKIEDSSAIE